MSLNEEVHAHDLDEFNPAAEIIEKGLDVWDKQKNVILAVVVVVAAALLGYRSYNYMQEQAIVEASDAYSLVVGDKTIAGEARISELEAVYENHSKTNYATYSAYLIAQEYLAQDKYEEALTWFDNVLASSSKNFVFVEATEGKAVALEGKGETESALAAYKEVLSMKEGTHRYNAVRLKLASLLLSLGKNSEAKEYCQAIVDDKEAIITQKSVAENLIATIDAQN